MAREFTLYWTSLKRYEECPQKFLWHRGWEGFDFGRGDGRGKEIPLKKSEHHALMGTVIQGVLEDFYNDEMWQAPELVKALDQKTEIRFAKELSGRYIDIHEDGTSRQEMLHIIRGGIMGFLRTFQALKLYGPYARSEVKCIAYVDPKSEHAGHLHPLGAYIDFLFRRTDTGITILDGKNSKQHWDDKAKEPMYYNDPDQLLFYALVFYLDTGHLPDRLGFIHFRYPVGYTWENEVKTFQDRAGFAKTDETAQKNLRAAAYYAQADPYPGVKWHPFNKDDVRGMAKRALMARAGMDAHLFDPTPSPKNCRFCDFEPICEARAEQKAKNSRGRRKNTKADIDLKGSGDAGDLVEIDF